MLKHVKQADLESGDDYILQDGRKANRKGQFWIDFGGAGMGNYLVDIVRLTQDPNIDIKDYVLAKPGVYAIKVLRKNNSKYLRGIANLGYRPTFNQKKILLEVHLINFSGNLYNKYLSVEFLKFIRKEKKFKNVNQLRSQIKTDLRIAKNTK